MSSSSSQQDPALMSFNKYGISLLIPYGEVASATNNFADENLIAESTSFKVYKGQLLDSYSGELIDIVAGKYLDLSVWYNEIMMSHILKHKNIVSIFKLAGLDDAGFIINKHEANGSLEKHLSGSTLTWIQRLHICVCIADALRYMHNLEDDESVIHGSIKSSHILLDHNWEPKLKGFGFAIRGKKHHLHPTTSKYNGSLEYMDPEYETTGGLTHKSDVFSFGVVLFEVLFGRKAEGENWYFARLARSHYEARTLDGMINSDLRKQMDEHSLKIFSETAYVCLKEGRALRPDMDQIYKKLREAFELQQSHESYVTSSNHLKVQGNPFWCRCNRGFIIERRSSNEGSRGRPFYACPRSVPGTDDYGCRYFSWKDEFERRLNSQASSSRQCSNCAAKDNEIRLLKTKIKMLETELELARNPENHACQSSAQLHELLNEMNNLHMS